MSAVYSIYTSPSHAQLPNQLPTLIVTPHNRPKHVLYTYLHNDREANYLLTPSDDGDLCVAKLIPPKSGRSTSSGSSNNGVKCEASRNLKWTINNRGIENPLYKITLPSQGQQDQPLFMISRTNPNATWWTMTYFTYAGHLIPPKRVEFGRIQKNSPESGGGTRVTITGKTDEQQAVWQTLGEANEDMVEWVVIASALCILDDEMMLAASKAGGGRDAVGAGGGYPTNNGDPRAGGRTSARDAPGGYASSKGDPRMGGKTSAPPPSLPRHADYPVPPPQRAPSAPPAQQYAPPSQRGPPPPQAPPDRHAAQQMPPPRGRSPLNDMSSLREHLPPHHVAPSRGEPAFAPSGQHYASYAPAAHREPSSTRREPQRGATIPTPAAMPPPQPKHAPAPARAPTPSRSSTPSRSKREPPPPADDGDDGWDPIPDTAFAVPAPRPQTSQPAASQQDLFGSRSAPAPVHAPSNVPKVNPAHQLHPGARPGSSDPQRTSSQHDASPREGQRPYEQLPQQHQHRPQHQHQPQHQQNYPPHFQQPQQYPDHQHSRPPPSQHLPPERQPSPYHERRGPPPPINTAHSYANPSNSRPPPPSDPRGAFSPGTYAAQSASGRLPSPTFPHPQRVGTPSSMHSAEHDARFYQDQGGRGGGRDGPPLPSPTSSRAPSSYRVGPPSQQQQPQYQHSQYQQQQQQQQPPPQQQHYPTYSQPPPPSPGGYSSSRLQKSVEQKRQAAIGGR